MNENLNGIKVLCGNLDIDSMEKEKNLVPFSDLVCDFLDALSSALLKCKEAKPYSDVITFAFFCRKANIQANKSKYSDEIERRIGRGISFHIAPSNVPVNFAYSMVASLLAGNSCIVRASSKDFYQVELICKCIGELLETEEFKLLKDYIAVIKYDRNSSINDYLSSIADVRIIWGGDQTINEIRKSPIKPRAVELAFSDRFSLVVIDAKSIIECDSVGRVVKDFYNDTYLFDQNACSSPRLVYWLGTDSDISKAKEIFWNSLHKLLVTNYDLKPIVSIDKYTMLFKALIELDSNSRRSADNLISRIELNSLPENIYEYNCPGGSFLEYSSESIDELSSIVTSRFQTLSYYGVEYNSLVEFVRNNGLSGIDRIVPIGKTTSFELIWDGYDLITSLSRVIF